MEDRNNVSRGSVLGKMKTSPISSSIWGSAILISIAILVGSVAIALSIFNVRQFSGAGLNNDISDKSGNSEKTDSGKTNVEKSGAVAPAPSEKKREGTTTLGSAPTLGNKKTAKVAIVEWSDLECPFCKKFHDETFDQIVKNYVDTGKVVFSFRNFPLDFHGDAAIKEANAALCVREAAGDVAYFKFVKDVYANTGTNGAGMSDEKLMSLATSAGGKSLSTCINDRKFKSVIDDDTKIGVSAGVQGVPGFIIGPLGKDGSVTGTIIPGAMPFSEFKKAIDAVLGA